MTAASLLALAIMTGGLPCSECNADCQPLRPRHYYRNACDGGKCLSCRRPLFGGDGAPQFDYRLVFNYPWSQTPAYPPLQPAVPSSPNNRQPEPVEPQPMPADAASSSAAATGHAGQSLMGPSSRRARPY